MRLHARYAPLLFGALLSAIMVMLVSAFVLLTSTGFTPDFFVRWLRSAATTWPVAFIAVTLLAPWVRRVVARITA